MVNLLDPGCKASFTEREDLSDADKRQILGGNPQTFYGFEC